MFLYHHWLATTALNCSYAAFLASSRRTTIAVNAELAMTTEIIRLRPPDLPIDQIAGPETYPQTGSAVGIFLSDRISGRGGK